MEKNEELMPEIPAENEQMQEEIKLREEAALLNPFHD
jgi:hypothetical protein